MEFSYWAMNTLSLDILSTLRTYHAEGTSVMWPPYRSTVALFTATVDADLVEIDNSRHVNGIGGYFLDCRSNPRICHRTEQLRRRRYPTCAASGMR